MFRKIRIMFRKIRMEFIYLDEERRDIIRFMSEEEYRKYRSSLFYRIKVLVSAIKEYFK